MSLDVAMSARDCVMYVIFLCLFTEEVEELSGRLKASRQRVGDLEKSYTDVSAGSQKQEKVRMSWTSIEFNQIFVIVILCQ